MSEKTTVVCDRCGIGLGPEHPKLDELDCDLCAEVGLEAWFPTDDALEAHVRSIHPDECAECEVFQAENRRELRNEPPPVPGVPGETDWTGWASLGAVEDA